MNLFFYLIIVDCLPYMREGQFGHLKDMANVVLLTLNDDCFYVTTASSL